MEETSDLSSSSLRASVLRSLFIHVTLITSFKENGLISDIPFFELDTRHVDLGMSEHIHLIIVKHILSFRQHIMTQINCVFSWFIRWFPITRRCPKTVRLHETGKLAGIELYSQEITDRHLWQAIGISVLPYRYWYSNSAVGGSALTDASHAGQEPQASHMWLCSRQ